MGDRHGGRFARRGRALSPSRPQVDAHRGVRFRWRATVFRCRGVVGRICPAGVRLRPTCRRTAGRPRPTDSRKTPLRRGRTHSACGHCRVHSPKKIRLLHETQLFYGESHVGSRQIFSSFPSVGRCVARERNPVPPVAPHRGSEHRGLRRTGEMCHGFREMVHRFDTMCPHGGKSLPRGGNGCPRGSRCYPSIRCFGERFHRRRCANPDACRGQRCSRG